jgi:hypothetical protein
VEDQVVVPRARHLQRVELEEREAVHGLEDALGSRRQRAGRREEVAEHEETTGIGPGELEGHGARC